MYTKAKLQKKFCFYVSNYADQGESNVWQTVCYLFYPLDANK